MSRVYTFGFRVYGFKVYGCYAAEMRPLPSLNTTFPRCLFLRLHVASGALLSLGKDLVRGIVLGTASRRDAEHRGTSLMETSPS